MHRLDKQKRHSPFKRFTWFTCSNSFICEGSLIASANCATKNSENISPVDTSNLKLAMIFEKIYDIVYLTKKEEEMIIWRCDVHWDVRVCDVQGQMN